MFVPFFSDPETESVDIRMREQNILHSERMRQNPNISAAEREAFERKAYGPNTPPPPTLEELERQVEADRASR
ncbi:MAG: hypothetical protein LBV54_08670 [Puniceicoccales bacterium]|nr:hypothetical protein [Puniceicoccales bacterium]